MNEPLLQNSEERIFTWNDVKRLVVRLRRKFFHAALIGAVLTFLFVCSRAPQYKVNASFKEENEKQGESLLQNFMGGVMMGRAQPQASTLMQSFQVLKPLIEKLGLQIGVSQHRFFLTKVYRRLLDNWKAERGIALEDPDNFIFQDVRYEGNRSLIYTLQFQDSDHFTIFDKGHCLATGTLGSQVCLPEVSFTIVKFPQILKLKTHYSLHIHPWVSVAESLRKEIQIQGSKTNQAILELSFSHRDRYLAARLLNELMDQYQHYLKFEHDRISLEQLEYLNQKQEQIHDKISSMFQEHASYLKHSLETKGIAGLKDEIQTVLLPYQKFQESILTIDLELAQLDEIEKGGEASFFSGEGCFFLQNQQLASRVQDLKQQRDLLEISFQHSDFLEQAESRLADWQGELRQIRDRRDRAQHFLRVAQENDGNSSDRFFDSKDSLETWLPQSKLQNISQDFAQYLENYVRLLSVQEKVIQEKCFYGNDSQDYFNGIDFKTARSLFVEYNTKLDTTEGLMSHYQHLTDKIKEDDFEVSALSAILKDPLSQSLILETNKIAIQLKDEKHHSPKEGQRWREEIAFQKKILGEHLEQLCKIEQLNSELIKEKMARLQQISLDCINQEISVLYERMNDSLKKRKEALLQEKKIIEKKMEELRHVSSDFPEKWKQEKSLDLNLKIGLKMIEVMTELVEGKTVNQHLHRIQSRPLDLGLVPLLPKKPCLLTASCLGGFVSAFGVFFISLLSTILSGFPTTCDKLKAIKYPLSGQISSLCDGPSIESVTGSDLEVLRQLSLFIGSSPKGKIIGLIAGKGPDYSYALAENLTHMSQRSLIFRCDFNSKFNASDLPGLLQVWKGEIKELPLRKKNGFDYLTAGGFALHGTEMLQSRFFQQILESVKENYDSIFILFRSPLSSAESTAALRLCDKAIVTVSGEPTEELTPFVQWAYHEGKYRLTFIVSENEKTV